MLIPSSRLRRLLLGALLGLAVVPGWAAEQKKVIVDFEDFGTWRTTDMSGVLPGAWWPADLGLSGTQGAKGQDEYVGEMKFAFDPASKGPYSLTFNRQKMTLANGFLSAVEFEADARNFPVSLRFEFQDAANKTFRTKPIALSGNGWKPYRLDINAETLPGFAKCKFPARLKRIILESSEAVTGSAFIDNLTLVGSFTKKDQLSILPIYEGIYYLPDQDVTLKYRLRNANPQAITGGLTWEVRDFASRQVATSEAKISLPAFGATEVSAPLGRLPIGAYNVVLKAQAGDFKVESTDTFGVFVPNNGQPNKNPMWFGVGDPTGWQGPTENQCHWEWMKVLGADINRMELFPDRFEPKQGLVAEESWGKLFQGHADAGVKVMLMYSGTPEWTQSKPIWRGPVDLFPQYEEHARSLGRVINKYPNVYSLEYWNEPDLEFFHGTLDDYVVMFRHFAKAIKEADPDLLLLSGGVTVKHPREKAGFSRGMFQKTADIYDIAAYHSHGPANNNEQNQKIVEGWLREAKIEGKRFTNTESGDRSLYDEPGRYRQAITLIKKIVYSKSIPGFDAYFWFTLQDYWDMDPEADDSFGLITSDNRAKPSFVAYNTLIRQLANTHPVTDGPTALGLVINTFRKDDGRYAYVIWPSASKNSGVLWIKTGQKVEVADMFGATQEVSPLGSILPISMGNQPIYLTGAQPGETIQIIAPGEEFLKISGEVNITNDEAVSVPVAFRNPTAEVLEGSLTFRDAAGATIATKAFKLNPGEELNWPAALKPSQPSSYEKQEFHLDLTLSGSDKPAFTFPVSMIGTYAIDKVAALSADPTKWPSLDAVTPIRIDQPEQVVELSYDPLIPAWKGPADLSASARIAHDGKGIRFQIAVTDDKAGPLQPKDKMFLGDDVQVAFAAPDSKRFAVLDLGKSEDGPVVWCPEHPDPSRIGPWQVPFHISQQGNVTTYDVYLPFDQLGLSVTKTPQPIRFTFMVNENDGQGRVRWIQWKDGIGRNRTLEMLGHGLLK